MGAMGLQLRGVDNFVPATQMGFEAAANYRAPDPAAVADLDRRIAQLSVIAKTRPGYQAEVDALKAERARMTGNR